MDSKAKLGTMTAEEFDREFTWSTNEAAKTIAKKARQDLLKELRGEVEGMKDEWETEPPEAGLENDKDGSEMYKCGTFDSLNRVIKLLEKYEEL